MTGRLRSPTVLWACVILAVLGWGSLRLDQAVSATHAAQAQFVSVNRDLQRLEDLRSRVQTPVRGRQAQDDLVTRAQDALTAAGLPTTCFSGVQPRADQTSNGLRIQTVQLRLQGLRPAEFGSWLAAWSTPDQPWRLSELQMVHATAPAQAAGMPLDSNRFDLMLVVTAPYVEELP
jgi:hypothetical protein